MWATSVPILVFLGLTDLDLGPMNATDRRRQTSDAHHRLMPPPYESLSEQKVLILDLKIDRESLITAVCGKQNPDAKSHILSSHILISDLKSFSFGSNFKIESQISKFRNVREHKLSKYYSSSLQHVRANTSSHSERQMTYRLIVHVKQELLRHDIPEFTWPSYCPDLKDHRQRIKKKLF